MIAHGLANHTVTKRIMWNRPMVKSFTEFLVTTIVMEAETKMIALSTGKVVEFL